MNLIWIVADTFRRDHLGAYGNEKIHTPALDALAAKSVRFDRHYAAGFPTMPARADYFTGRWTMSFMRWEPLPADAKTVAQKVLTTHFVRDIAGNLRAFSTQNFRCKKCNKRFRRLPLQGRCPDCKSPITLTVYRGGIEKYLESAYRLVKKYGLSTYYTQRLTLMDEEISALFNGKKPKQISLVDFV